MKVYLVLPQIAPLSLSYRRAKGQTCIFFVMAAEAANQASLLFCERSHQELTSS
jgi:hypothetical protein